MPSGAVTADRHHGRVAAEARGIGCGPSEGVLGIVPSRWIGILRCEPILHRHNNRFGLVRHQPHRPVRSRDAARHPSAALEIRSEEHTSELQSLMRISYAVFCLTKKKKQYTTLHHV